METRLELLDFELMIPGKFEQETGEQGKILLLESE
jgi:hypothetical protein